MAPRTLAQRLGAAWEAVEPWAKASDGSGRRPAPPALAAHPPFSLSRLRCTWATSPPSSCSACSSPSRGRRSRSCWGQCNEPPHPCHSSCGRWGAGMVCVGGGAGRDMHFRAAAAAVRGRSTPPPGCEGACTQLAAAEWRVHARRWVVVLVLVGLVGQAACSSSSSSSSAPLGTPLRLARASGRVVVPTQLGLGGAACLSVVVVVTVRVQRALVLPPPIFINGSGSPPRCSCCAHRASWPQLVRLPRPDSLPPPPPRPTTLSSLTPLPTPCQPLLHPLGAQRLTVLTARGPAHSRVSAGPLTPPGGPGSDLMGEAGAGRPRKRQRRAQSAKRGRLPVSLPRDGAPNPAVLP